MSSKVRKRQKVANHIINPTSHPDSNKFPRRRKIPLKRLLCNLFQMHIKLIVAAVCLFSEPSFSKGKSKKNIRLEWVSVAHCYHLTFYISIWHLILCTCYLKLSKIRVEIISLVKNCSPVPRLIWPLSIKHSDLNSFYCSYPFPKCI